MDHTLLRPTPKFTTRDCLEREDVGPVTRKVNNVAARRYVVISRPAELTLGVRTELKWIKIVRKINW